ncbi:hypothetical protein [Halapricum salinum]|nr:hypothetical protein [Halapricum salinum]
MGHEWACHWAGKRSDEEDTDTRFTLKTRAERRERRRASDDCE